MNIPIPIAREGWPFITPGLLLFLIFLFTGCATTAFIFGILTLCIALFFRDPERKVIQDETLVLSPADGKIIKITRDGDQESATQTVSIFMSVCNCHINRIPLSGKITRIAYNPGKFLAAYADKASELNEQNTISIQNNALEVRVRQIAGLIARRIVCRVKTGEPVRQGDRFGLIRFGSRVDIILPPSIEILVRHDQKVKAGLSVIGRTQ